MPPCLELISQKTKHAEKKLLDNSPGISPHEKFDKENIRELKRVLNGFSVKTPYCNIFPRMFTHQKFCAPSTILLIEIYPKHNPPPNVCILPNKKYYT